MATQASTAELVAALQNIDGKAEIVAGEIVLMSPTGDLPSRAAAAIYRSLWDYQQRTRSGRAYTDNPDLTPSRNHHGMADYRRYLGHRLRFYYLMRMPTQSALASGELDGTYVLDTWLTDRLTGMAGSARLPDLLRAVLDDTDDGVVSETEHAQGGEVAHAFVALERERDEAAHRADDLARALARATDERDRARAQASLTAGDRVRRRAGRTVRRVRGILPGFDP